MKMKRMGSLLLALLLAFSVLFGTTGVIAEASEDSESPSVDLSIFTLNPDTDRDKYLDGLLKTVQFLGNTRFLISTMENKTYPDKDFVDDYYNQANRYKFAEVLKYMTDPKYKVNEVMEEYCKKMAEQEADDEWLTAWQEQLDSMKEFQKKYIDLYVNKISKEIDQFMNTAYAGRNDKQEALKTLDTADKLCDAVILTTGDYKPALEKKESVKKMRDKILGPVANNKYSYNFQKNNSGKILFANKLITPGKETADSFKSTITPGDFVYAVAYLPMGMNDMKLGSGESGYIGYEAVSVSVEYLIDGEMSQMPAMSVIVKNADYDANKPYIVMEILPDPKTATMYNATEWFNQVFEDLTPMQHTITLKLQKNGDVIAEGSFTIDWSDADTAKIKKNAELANKNAVDYRAKNRKLPAAFKEKHVPYKDKSITDAKIKEMYTKNNKNVKKVIKVVNVDGEMGTEWMIEKNDYGIPVRKISSHYTWVLYEGKDGWCYFNEIKIYSTYTGAGKYGAPYVYEKFSPVKITKANAGVK